MPDDTAPGSVRKRAWGWVIVGLVLLIAATAVVLVDMSRYFTVSEITLPNLVGLPYDQAAGTLRREGLEPVAFVEHVSGMPAEVVSSQSPEAGTVVKKGRSVHLGVNTPPAEVLIPDLVGLAQNDAIARAAEMNLPVGTITFEPSSSAAGRVIAQQPIGGERLGEQRTLQLTVSAGPPRPDQEMPDVTGLQVDDAVIELRALGFRLIERLPSSVSFSEPGSVVSTIPPPGETVALSTPVIVQYSLSTGTAVRVPDVIGLPQWRAQLALRAAQLLPGEVTFIQDPSRPEGVVEVQPTGYTLPGTPVLLTVNGEEPSPLFPSGSDVQTGFPDLTPGPLDPGSGSAFTRGETTPGASGTPRQPAADGSRQVPFSFDPTNMGVRRLLEEPYSLRVVVVDERGERDVLDRRLNPGQSVSTTISVYGADAMLQTYIDDVFFQAWRP